jgi:hypothetical protein
MPIEKSDDISKNSTIELWLLENKTNTYFSPILNILLAKSQNLARKKRLLEFTGTNRRGRAVPTYPVTFLVPDGSERRSWN